MNFAGTDGAILALKFLNGRGQRIAQGPGFGGGRVVMRYDHYHSILP
jgi:hypothetical protein